MFASRRNRGNKTLMRSGLAYALAAAMSLWVSSAVGQQYPSRPVQMVVAFPPGGVGDLVARFIADKLASALGQPVNIENRPGETGTIGTNSVIRSAPDGYTLLAGQTTEIIVNRVLAGELRYNPDSDLRPIALLAISPVVLTTQANAPYSSVDELVKAARETRRGLLFGSGGLGTPGHLAGELLRARTKARLSHVPFEGGGPALEALLNGRVDFYFPVLLTAMPQIASGQIKALTIASSKRSPTLSNIPTLAEAGIRDIDVNHWVGIFAPARTPDAVVARLNTSVRDVLAQPDVKERLRSSGADLTPMSVDEFRAFLKAETDKYTLLIRQEFCSRLWYGGCGGFPMD
jgi:tripartite-type tricarboxylate transporter receptor subunit TctC